LTVSRQQFQTGYGVFTGTNEHKRHLFHTQILYIWAYTNRLYLKKHICGYFTDNLLHCIM